jgi:hypothetical protein
MRWIEYLGRKLMACGDVGVSLLGSVEMRNGSARLELTRLELALVSALAITPGRPVSVDRLIDFIWSARHGRGHSAPGSADLDEARSERVASEAGTSRSGGDVIVAV